MEHNIVADPEFSVMGDDPVGWGGTRPPTHVLFGENKYQDERIGFGLEEAYRPNPLVPPMQCNE